MVRILLVDEARVFRHLVATVLGFRGYIIDEVSSGTEALEKIRSQLPDLVLTELHLPGMSGIELCRRIKKDPALQSIPLVMVTSSGREQDIRVALQAGCDDYLTKPLDDATLIRKLQELLGSADKRRFSRIPTSLQISFEDFKGIFFEYTRDVSRTGVFIEMEKPLPKDTRLHLSFSLPPPFSHPVKAYGRVVRSVDATAEKGGGMGVSFICLDEDSQRIIDALVATQSSYEKNLRAFSRVSYRAEAESSGWSPEALLNQQLEEMRSWLRRSQDEQVHLSAAFSLVDNLHLQPTPGAVLSVALDILGDLLGVAACGIFLLDPQRKELFAVGRRGLPAASKDRLPIEGPLELALRETSLQIPDPPYPIENTGLKVLAACPILHRDRALGVVTIHELYPHKTALGARDPKLLRLLGKHLGLALVNAVARLTAGDQPDVAQILKVVSA